MDGIGDLPAGLSELQIGTCARVNNTKAKWRISSRTCSINKWLISEWQALGHPGRLVELRPYPTR